MVTESSQGTLTAMQSESKENKKTPCDHSQAVFELSPYGTLALFLESAFFSLFGNSSHSMTVSQHMKENLSSVDSLS